MLTLSNIGALSRAPAVLAASNRPARHTACSRMHLWALALAMARISEYSNLLWQILTAMAKLPG